MKPSSILEKIQSSGAKPIPAWKFAAARWGVRAALAAALAAAAIGAGLALREAWEPGADLVAGRFRNAPAPWAFHVMPLLWLSACAVLFAIAIFLFRRLPTGYRWRGVAMTGVVLSCVAALAAAALAVGGPRLADQALRAAVPGFSDWSDARREEFFRDVWMRPEGGVIAGTVLSSASGSFALAGLDGRTWDVAYSGTLATELSASGARVRAFGEASGTGSFRAVEVRPMTPRHGDLRGPGMMFFGRDGRRGARDRDFACGPNGASGASATGVACPPSDDRFGRDGGLMGGWRPGRDAATDADAPSVRPESPQGASPVPPEDAAPVPADAPSVR